MPIDAPTPKEKEVPTLSPQTLAMAVQGVDAEIRRIREAAGGDVDELEPDAQELLLAFSQAATELKTAYTRVQQAMPDLPPYEELVAPNP